MNLLTQNFINRFNIFITLLFCTLFFYGCSNKSTYEISELNGIRYFQNKNVSKKISRYVTLNEEFKITPSSDTYQAIKDFDIDNQGNLYILDIKLGRILKFNNQGNLLTTFGDKGQGPGEFLYPNCMSILADTIFLSCPNLKKVIKYHTSGKYLEDINIKNFTKPRQLRTVSNTSFIAFKFTNNFSANEEYVTNILTLFDNSFNTQKELSSFSLKKNELYDNILTIFTPYAVSENRIFIADNKKDQLCVNIFDNQGNLKSVLTDFSKRIKFSKEEKAGVLSKFKALGSNKYSNLKLDYKCHINGLYFDNTNQKLWVLPSIERKKSNANLFVVDLYSKEGIYQERVCIKNFTGYDHQNIDEFILIKGNNLYKVDLVNSDVLVFKNEI